MGYGRPKKTDRNERIAKAYAGGLSMSDTASRFRVSVPCVHRILKRDYPDLIRAPHVHHDQPAAESTP